MLKLTAGNDIQKAPVQIVLEGAPGSGKTTAAAMIPGNFLFDVESGSGRVAGNFTRIAAPENYENLIEQMRELYKRREELGVRCITIDSIDAVEQLITDHVFRTIPGPNGRQVTSIEGYGYGKGYVYVAEKFDELQRYLDAFRAVGVAVIIIAHVKTISISRPDQDAYQRFGIKLGRNAGSILLERSDAVLMADFELLRKSDNKVADINKRVLYTEATTTKPDLKNRFGLPPKMDFKPETLKEIFESCA